MSRLEIIEKLHYDPFINNISKEQLEYIINFTILNYNNNE